MKIYRQGNGVVLETTDRVIKDALDSFGMREEGENLIVIHKPSKWQEKKPYNQILKEDNSPYGNSIEDVTLALMRIIFKKGGGAGNYYTITELEELPKPVNAIIDIPENTTLFIPSTLDLQGNRLRFAPNCCIQGTSSETSLLFSTLADGVALITSTGSLPVENIALSALPLNVGNQPVVINLNGASDTNAALDWKSVNIIGSNIGTVQNYTNAVFKMCAFIGNTGGIVFDGTFDSIVFETSIFRNGISGTCIKVNPTTVINRRIRIENTPIVAVGTQIGLDVSPLAAIPIEGYILKFVNFSGNGTYLSGVQASDNKALIYECRGVQNSASIAEYYMVNNTTATAIANTTTFVKIAGTTIAGQYVQRFTLANNKATYTGAISKYFLVNTVVSANSGNAHLLIFRIAKNGTTIPASESQINTSGSGRSENIKIQTIVQFNTNDYIEVFVSNNSANTAVVATELNVTIIPVS